MTNLQHVALFMFLMFLPMGRDVVLLLVSQCLALSTFNLSAKSFAFSHVDNGEARKEPEFDKFTF